MASRRARILLACLLLAAPAARAILPENGWYWNPNESGRGFNIEIQNNMLFMSAFVYLPDGTPVWYVGGGPMSSDRQWSSSLLRASGGQCLGCGYRAPDLDTVGTVSINFTSERSATISLPGETIATVRQDWSGHGTSTRDALFGEWSFTEGDPDFPIYSGERIALSAARTGTSGPYAAGSRTGSSASIAIGTWDSVLAKFAILLDSSTSYYRLYVFTLNTLNRAEGLFWLYRKTSSPTGPGTYFVAHRTKSLARLQTGVGPGISKVASAEASLREAVEALLAARPAASAKAEVADEKVRELARVLEAGMIPFMSIMN